MSQPVRALSSRCPSSFVKFRSRIAEENSEVENVSADQRLDDHLCYMIDINTQTSQRTLRTSFLSSFIKFRSGEERRETEISSLILIRLAFRP